MRKQAKELSSSEISAFCKGLGMFFSGGIPLYEAFLIMEENAASPADAALYRALSQDVGRGHSLTDALTGANCFPPYMLRMVRVGEDSGKLEEVFESLSLYYQRRESLSAAMKSAVLYPLAMVLVMLAILAVLMIKILPVFSQVFEQVGARFPALLQTMADSRDTVTLLCVILFLAAALLALFYLTTRHTQRGRRLLTRIYENAPLTRSLAEKSESNKFTYSMSLLLSSGVNINESVALIYELTDSPGAQAKIARLKASLDKGTPFPNALTDSGLLTSQYSAMLAVGLKTGKSDEMMNLIAERYSRDTERWIERLISAIEPTIVIIMCLLIGSVLMSVMLPLIRIMAVM